MYPNKSASRILVSAFLLIFLSACIAPNKEIVQLRKDVEMLKSDNARLSARAGIKSANGVNRIDSIEKDLASLKTALGKINRLVKESRASTVATLDSIKGDFQSLIGRFEEVMHMKENISEDNNEFIETADNRMSEIETGLRIINQRLADLALNVNKLSETLSFLQDEAKDRPKIPANELYKSALDLIRNRKTRESRALFKQYLADYPKGALANNAQYWIGESYYGEREYEKAIVEYDDVIKKFPSGSKVPAAMLKQGMSFRNIKDYKTGNAILKNLIKKYPKSDEAKKAKKLTRKKKSKKKKKPAKQ